jgi:hypothetical protein
MNIKHSVIAPAPSGSRSLLRRVVAVAASSILLLGVASASADGGPKGDYKVHAKAAAFNVDGVGKFSVTQSADSVTFIANTGEIKMEGKRHAHTVGPETKIGLAGTETIKLTVPKARLKFPEPGKTSDAYVPGKLSIKGKEAEVAVHYVVENAGGKYVLKNAAFVFKYPEFLPKACFAGVCVDEKVNVFIEKSVTLEVTK